MKIMHIMAGHGQGGAETYSTDVMLSLHREGAEQCVVMAADAPRYNELNAAGLRMIPSVMAVPFSWWRKSRLTRLINDEKPDIIHCWMRRAASLLPVTNIPTIGWFGGYYEPKHFKHCRDFVGVTRDIVTHMVTHGVAPAHAHYIPTFPDIAVMPPVNRADLDTPHDAKVVLALSRLHPKKGLDTLLDALAKMPATTYAWLAGDGPDEAKLRQQCTALGLDNRVRFLGWRTDRAALLGAADVCVMPSRYEPFGTVILEAWAARVPFVACKSAGPAAHVTDGENGLLVEIDDVAGLAAALTRVLDDQPLRAKLTANGHQTYEASYTRAAVTRQWLDFYNRLHQKAAA
jgi:hypothetical protein